MREIMCDCSAVFGGYNFGAREEGRCRCKNFLRDCRVVTANRQFFTSRSEESTGRPMGKTAEENLTRLENENRRIVMQAVIQTQAAKNAPISPKINVTRANPHSGSDNTNDRQRFSVV